MSKITMYTTQTQVVLDAIERDGISYVKQEYIIKKYGEIAWIFREAYRFFTNQAQQIVPKPKEVDSPVWVFFDPKWSQPTQDAVQLKLEIPEEELVLFDLRNWSKILNLSYIGSKEEEEKFEKELSRQGITASSDVFTSSFYPALKSKIKSSWRKLFDDHAKMKESILSGQEDPTASYVQGAVWYIKKEWIVH